MDVHSSQDGLKMKVVLVELLKQRHALLHSMPTAADLQSLHLLKCMSNQVVSHASAKEAVMVTHKLQ
jgi:hypothetical protein